MTRIIVFDTGTGGKIFAEHFRQEILGAKITEAIDYTNSPYGSRSPSEILTLTESTLVPHLNTSAPIVIACNTATECALNSLRTKYPNQLFIGTEPGIKPASKLTNNGKILVLATPATLRSSRYQNLKNKYAKHLNIYEPNCTDWAKKIDNDTLTAEDIARTLVPYQPYSPDVIVLACTHYLAIPPQILTDIFPDATVYSPLPDITDYIKTLL